MRIQNFLGDVLRTAAVHLLAGTVSKTLEEAAKEGRKKAEEAYKQYKKKLQTTQKKPESKGDLDAEDAIEITTPKTNAMDEMRKLKGDKSSKRVV